MCFLLYFGFHVFSSAAMTNTEHKRVQGSWRLSIERDARTRTQHTLLMNFRRNIRSNKHYKYKSACAWSYVTCCVMEVIWYTTTTTTSVSGNSLYIRIRWMWKLIDFDQCDKPLIQNSPNSYVSVFKLCHMCVHTCFDVGVDFRTMRKHSSLPVWCANEPPFSTEFEAYVI